MVAWRGRGRASCLQLSTLAREHLEYRICGHLHGTGQAYGCFADIPNPQLKSRGCLARLLFWSLLFVPRVIAVGSGERMTAFRL